MTETRSPIFSSQDTDKRRAPGWALGGLVVLLALQVVGAAIERLDTSASLGRALAGLAGMAAVVVVAVWAYVALIMRRWAGRDPVEITGPGKVRNLAGGIVVGVVFMAACVGAAILLGGYRVDGVSTVPTTALVNLVAFDLVAMFVEELIFRGVLLQAIETWAGTATALVASSLLFGVAHLLMNATIVTALAIAVEAGFFLGAAFLWRRSLWFVIGIHGAWNLTESLLGVPVTGRAPAGLLQLTAQGGAVLNGGGFGIEASMVPVVLGAALGVFFLVRRRRA